MTNEPQNPWYADGLRFSCTQCGNCCGGAPGFVWINREETRSMADFLRMDVSEFETRHTRINGGRRSLLERPNGDCEFLVRESDGKSRCSIHAVRPIQCRTWPFWSANVKSEKTWAHAARGCPGINIGQHHPLPVIQQALARNASERLPL